MTGKFKVLSVAVLISASLFLAGCQKVEIKEEPGANSTPQSTSTTTQGEDETPIEQVKSAHFVSSQPIHGDTLNAAPKKVLLNFDFTLGSGSKATVTNMGKVVSAEDVEISADKLSFEVPITGGGSGVYNVNYTACWPDGSCHNGSFSFSVK